MLSSAQGQANQEEEKISLPTRENSEPILNEGDSFILGGRDISSLREPLKAEDLPAANMEAIEFLPESEKNKIQEFFRSHDNIDSLNTILRSAHIVK